MPDISELKLNYEGSQLVGKRKEQVPQRGRGSWRETTDLEKAGGKTLSWGYSF